MFKVTDTGLGYVDIGDQRQHDVGREALFEVGFDADGVCRVDQDACVLGCDDRFDDRAEVKDVGQGLDAQHDIVVGVFPRGGFFWRPYDYKQVSSFAPTTILSTGRKW